MKEDSAYNTPERGTSRRDNKPITPPPRKPVHSKDVGLAYKTGFGMGQGALHKYRTAEALEFAVNQYFDKKIEEGRHFTIAGLALSLGFRSSSRLKAYEERGEEFAEVIEVARTRIEEDKNDLLLEGGRATNGVIFDLKNNHGWKERSETTTTHEAGSSLAELVLALQGNVLRPKLVEYAPDLNAVIDFDGEFEELIANPPDLGLDEDFA